MKKKNNTDGVFFRVCSVLQRYSWVRKNVCCAEMLNARHTEKTATLVLLVAGSLPNTHIAPHDTAYEHKTSANQRKESQYCTLTQSSECTRDRRSNCATYMLRRRWWRRMRTHFFFLSPAAAAAAVLLHRRSPTE